MTGDTEVKKKRKSRKKSDKISFDEEIVPKHVAEELSLKLKDNLKQPPTNVEVRQHKKKKVKPITKQTENEGELKELIPLLKTNEGDKLSPKRKKKRPLVKPPEKQEIEVSNPESNAGLVAGAPTEKKEESIRAKKRKKHHQLLVDKKLKVDLELQKKSLNYLSKWKHSRGEWKFEKLRQIWLQQNVFDSDRIPDQFWETLVEYFSNAHGGVRKTLLDDALKIIQDSELHNDSKGKEDDDDVEDCEGESSKKGERARSIIQSLQE